MTDTEPPPESADPDPPTEDELSPGATLDEGDVAEPNEPA